MKPKKICWIHRKFPRYYQWWWSISIHEQACWIGFFAALGVGAVITPDLFILIIVAGGFAAGLFSMSIKIRKFKAEDLCK